MRELRLIANESTRSSLVFEAIDGEEQFFLAVDDDLRSALLADDTSAARTSAPASPESAAPGTTAPGSASEPASEGQEAHQLTSTSPTEVPASAAPASAAAEPEATERSSDPGSAVATPAAQEDPAAVSSAADASQHATKQPKQPRESRPVDPRLANPLKMRPREIQERIRGGASVADLAEENGVTEARIEAYAHPVILERARIAEMAKQSHPVRDDGPAKLTLWEILATAFAARDIDLATSQWDAYRDPSGQWVVRVTWRSGISEQTAEWNYLRNGMSAARAVARNALAADLTDPDFAKPVRTITPFPRRAERDATSGPDHQLGQVSASEYPTAETPVVRDADEHHDAEEIATGELLMHPNPEQDAQAQSKPKRRRKAVTPHWEDVLLGVRTNTKRPRK